MSDRQFVACKFRIGDTRTFTYHNDGEPVHDGDAVRVPDKSGEGWKKVFVVDANAPEPTEFATKGILGLHVEDPDAATGCADDQTLAGISSDKFKAAAIDALDTPLAF